DGDGAPPPLAQRGGAGGRARRAPRPRCARGGGAAPRAPRRAPAGRARHHPPPGAAPGPRPAAPGGRGAGARGAGRARPGGAARGAAGGIPARQHGASLARLGGAGGVTVATLTGASSAAERRALQARLAAGEALLVVGTHALLEERLQFPSLALAIVDEQH